MTILIIDDEVHIRQMMRLALEASGYTVIEASNGDEGLARFGDGAGIDGVVLDQKMPGIDGLETLRQIRKRAPQSAVLMVTAFASIELAVDAMKLGAADFLRKPMTPESLRASVAAVLTEPAPARPPERAAPGAIGRPAIETLTLNGFRILRSERGADLATADHVFRVTRFPERTEIIVTVTIDPAAVARVARLTKRTLEPDGAFWHQQAERLLADFLWGEGKAPDNGRLTVRDISREALDLAAAWPFDEAAAPDR
jgi:DNA-binding response OmpR family regulator